MRKPLKLILSVLCVILTLTAFSAVSAAVPVSGIGVSQNELRAGEAFDIIIYVPAAERADSVSLKISYDWNAFDVTSWVPPVAGAEYNVSEGIIAMTFASATRDVDLSGGLELRASMTVKAGASDGDYTFRLEEHSFSYILDNGYDYVELWNPSVTEVGVRIGDPASGQQSAAETQQTTAPAENQPDTASDSGTGTETSRLTVTTEPPVTEKTQETAGRVTTVPVTDKAPSAAETRQTANTTAPAATERLSDNTSSRSTEASDSIKPDSGTVTERLQPLPESDNDDRGLPDENGAPADESVSDGYGATDGGRPPERDNQTDDNRSAGDNISDDGRSGDGLYVPAAADTTQPPSGRGRERAAHIGLVSDLKGLPSGSIHASTKTNYFDGDTEIVFANTDDAEKSASEASRGTGLVQHRYYAFDISLYDTASGRKIHALNEGDIEFTIPVPRIFGGEPDNLAVYHTEDGFAQQIPSSLIYEDGQAMLRFRASSFSPYMIVDLSEAAVQQKQPAQRNTDTYSSPAPAASDSGIRNPDTGVAAAVFIPSALIVCSVLSKKGRNRRKRTKRFIE